MDRFSATSRSTFSKASNLILNQSGINRSILSRESGHSSGFATPAGYMSGTQFQLLKDSKVNENISRDLMSNADKALPPERFLAKKKGESKKEELYEHEKTVLKKKKMSKRSASRQGDHDDTDERQIKSEIDYSDKNSYYAPSLKQGRRSSSSTNRSQLSKANVKAVFGGSKQGEGSVSSHKRSKSSAYSRPTTSAAMSVVSSTSTSYYTVTDSKRSYNTEESIMEGSEEEDDASDNSSNASEEEEKRGEKERAEELEEELAKAEKEEARRLEKEQKRKKREQRKLEREAKRKEKEEKEKKVLDTPQIPSQISVPDSLAHASYLRENLKTAGVQEPRKWKLGLGEKLTEKDYGDDVGRQDKINRRMNKEREKALVGQRLARENEKILSDMRSQKSSKSSSVASYSMQYSQTPSIMSRSYKPRLVPKFSNSLRISTGIIRDEQMPDKFTVPMVSSSHSAHTTQQAKRMKNRVFDQMKVDKINFKRMNVFGAYVNAAFKGGVFQGAPTDSA